MALSVTVGAGQVIPGFDEGLVGLRLGGRRQLTIPSDLAYGEQGQPPDIGPNETLANPPPLPDSACMVLVPAGSDDQAAYL